MQFQPTIVKCEEEYIYEDVNVDSKEENRGGSRLVGAREIKHEAAPFLVAINSFG